MNNEHKCKYTPADKEPRFRLYDGTLRIYVKCEDCNARTWLTKIEWLSDPDNCQCIDETECLIFNCEECGRLHKE